MCSRRRLPATYLNHGLFLLVDGARERALAPVVESIGIGAVLQEQFDQVGVAMVGGQHELRGRWGRESGEDWGLVLLPRDRRLGVGRTRESPFWLVMLEGKPAGKACWKMGRSPFRAASYILEARARASGDKEPVSVSMACRTVDDSWQAKNGAFKADTAPVSLCLRL